MPRIGTLPCERGLCWSGVAITSSLPPAVTSQAQPLPNRPAAAVENFSLKPAKLPKAELIASGTGPLGRTPFLRHSRNSEWFACPRRGCARLCGHSQARCPGSAEKILDSFTLKLGVALQGRVQFIYIGLMMPGMVNLHGLCIDIRLESII